ncbi:MAG: DUF2877 domain-containing protein [Candidatus Scatomorpha sp.]
MSCKALDVGALAFRCVTTKSGTVNAVLSKSLSLSYPPYCVTLYEAPYATPLGIVTKGLEPLQFRVRPGWRTVWQGSQLQIEGETVCFSNMRLRKDLRIKTRYPCSDGQRQEALSQLSVFLSRAHKTSLISVILSLPSSENSWVENFAHESFQTQIEGMFGAARLGNSRAAAEYAASLCGLGMGLSPAGDDFLTGMIALFGMISLNEREKAFVSDFLSALASNISPSQTNPWGWSFVKPAFEGWQSAPLTAAMYDVLLQRDYSSVRTLASIGGSSGLDQLCGIATGLKILTELQV